MYNAKMSGSGGYRGRQVRGCTMPRCLKVVVIEEDR